MRESEPSRAQSVPDCPPAKKVVPVTPGQHQDGFTAIVNRIAQDPRLESDRIYVIGYLYAVGTFAGTWEPRIRQPDSLIAKQAGMSVSKLRRVETLLVDAGYIKKHSIDKSLDATGREIELLWLVTTQCTDAVEIKPPQRARRGRPPKQKVSVPQNETFQKVSVPQTEINGKSQSPRLNPLSPPERDFRRNSLPDKEVSDPLKIKIRSAAARCSPLPPIQPQEEQTKTPQGLTSDQSAALDAMREKIRRSKEHSQHESSLMELLQGEIPKGSDLAGLDRFLDRVLNRKIDNPPGLLRTILETEGPAKAPPRPETARAKPSTQTITPEDRAMYQSSNWGLRPTSTDGGR